MPLSDTINYKISHAVTTETVWIGWITKLLFVHTVGFWHKTYDYSDYKFTERHAEDFSEKRKYKVRINN